VRKFDARQSRSLRSASSGHRRGHWGLLASSIRSGHIKTASRRSPWSRKPRTAAARRATAVHIINPQKTAIRWRALTAARKTGRGPFFHIAQGFVGRAAGRARRGQGRPRTSSAPRRAALIPDIGPAAGWSCLHQNFSSRVSTFDTGVPTQATPPSKTHQHLEAHHPSLSKWSKNPRRRHSGPSPAHTPPDRGPKPRLLRDQKISIPQRHRGPLAVHRYAPIASSAFVQRGTACILCV